jgi:hypothetical protein
MRREHKRGKRVTLQLLHLEYKQAHRLQQLWATPSENKTRHLPEEDTSAISLFQRTPPCVHLLGFH